VARAYTGKPKLVRFATHFHGWHDHVAFGKESAGPKPPAGILQEIVDNVLVCPPGDLPWLDELCRDRDDVAAVILEPTGATFGKVPLDPGFLTELRRWTTQRGILLIFDEVVSGFRCSLGGAQGFYGVTPDLTTLAKIVGGGYPGAALVGRAEVMQVMDLQEGDNGPAPPLVVHYGTYNAAPVTASAGIATLRYLQSTDLIARANASGARLRQEMNLVAQRLGCDWCVYGDFSAFHIFPNPDHDPVTPADIMAGRVDSWKLRGAASTELQHKVRVSFLCSGVDILPWPGGLVSGVHTDEDLQRTVEAFEGLLKMLDREGSLK
jgi:glutamate-1-semialdehyde 2,1-aminomutase